MGKHFAHLDKDDFPKYVLFNLLECLFCYFGYKQCEVPVFFFGGGVVVVVVFNLNTTFAKKKRRKKKEKKPQTSDIVKIKTS